MDLHTMLKLHSAVEGRMLFHGRCGGCPAGCMFLRDGGQKKSKADSSGPIELSGSGPDSDRRPVKRRSRTRADNRLLGSGVRPKKKVSLSCFHTYLFNFLNKERVITLEKPTKKYKMRSFGLWKTK